jgi:hypothetical protein
MEVISRFTLERPERVIIEALDTKVEYAQGPLVTVGLPDRGLYLSTNTGIRLKRNARVLVRRHTLSKRDVEISTNSLGFRHKELPKKKENEYRVLVLGDSVTFGAYLPFEETYPARIEAYLKENAPEELEGKEIQVINAAIGGIDLQNELAILLETGLSIEPDIVIVGHYLNDANVSLYLNITRLPSLLHRSYLLSFLAKRLDILRAAYKYEQVSKEPSFQKEREKFFISKRISNADWSSSEAGFNRLILEAMNDWGYSWTLGAWEKTAHLTKLLKDLSETHGFKLAFLMLPVRYQVEAKIEKDFPQRKFHELMLSLEIKHLDLLPALREKYQRDGVNIFYDHCHQNKEGNDFIASEISKWLADDVI